MPSSTRRSSRGEVSTLAPDTLAGHAKVPAVEDPLWVPHLVEEHRRERGLESAFEGPPARAPPAA